MLGRKQVVQTEVIWKPSTATRGYFIQTDGVLKALGCECLYITWRHAGRKAGRSDRGFLGSLGLRVVRIRFKPMVFCTPWIADFSIP